MITSKKHHKLTVFKALLPMVLIGAFLPIQAQIAKYNTPGDGNPVLPGYFADPTVKKFGDTYYIYATTDGSGAGFGPAQLWQSKDFRNWTLMPMNWPDSHWIWAPDVMYNPQNKKYYYLYCQPCKLHLGISDTPVRPSRMMTARYICIGAHGESIKASAVEQDASTPT